MENGTGNETTYQFLEECNRKHVLGFLIYGITLSVSIILGILGNVASLIVLVQPSMRSSTSILLVAMAAYDTLILTLKLLPLVDKLHYAFNLDRDSVILSVFAKHIFYYIVEIALTGTIYTTVVVTIERAVVVVFPLKAKLVCTNTRASFACVAVFLWSLIYSVPIFILYQDFFRKNRIKTSYMDFRNGYFYRYVYKLYLNTVFHTILPVGVIIILNIAIIQRLCMRGRRIIHQVSSGGDNQIQLTVMIIVLTGIFCASRVLYVTVIYLNEQERFEHEWRESMNSTKQEFVFECFPKTLIVRIAKEISIIMNSATNFIVYSIFGHKFRRCLHELCCSRLCLQAPRSPPETQLPSGNTLSTSATSLHLHILQERQRVTSPSKTSAPLAVPEPGL